MKLKDKIAIVTGGSRGIGRAVAQRLAAEGASIALVYRANEQAAEGVAQGIRAAGGRAQTFQADVADDASVKAAVQKIAAAFGRVDILVNNAGVFDGSPLGEISRAQFEDQFFNNAWSVVATLQAALPHFPAEGGAVVNVGSSLVYEPEPATVIYSASKGAVDVLTRGFAIELGPRQIRVNAVAPAITRTDMTAGIPAEHLKAETARTPLGRLAEPTDVADVVAFLAGPDSRWVTGRTVLVDGGRI